MNFLAKIGAAKALRLLGLTKIAEDPALQSVQAPDSTAEEAPRTRSNLQNALVAGAGLAPFAGLIGEKPLINDPIHGAQGARYRTMDELSRAAMPGDVLVTSKPTGSMWKYTMSPLTGTEFYHAQPVVGRRGGKGLTVSAGQYVHPSWSELSNKELRENIGTVGEKMRREYPDVVLLRPKNMTDAQRAAFARDSLSRSKKEYDSYKAINAWLKDLVLPKVEGLTDVGTQTVCEGNVCSTLPAMSADVATEGGVKVLRGKRPQDVMPADFLRSTEYELVGSRLPNVKMTPEMQRLRALSPYLSRAALGAGAAGATYLATEDPPAAAIPVGAIAGNLAAEKAMPHLFKKYQGERGKALLEKEMPSTFDTFMELLNSSNKYRGKILKNFGLRRLPGIAAGAGLAYGGVKGLEHLLTKDKKGQ